MQVFRDTFAQTMSSLGGRRTHKVAPLGGDYISHQDWDISYEDVAIRPSTMPLSGPSFGREAMLGSNASSSPTASRSKSALDNVPRENIAKRLLASRQRSRAVTRQSMRGSPSQPSRQLISLLPGHSAEEAAKSHGLKMRVSHSITCDETLFAAFNAKREINNARSNLKTKIEKWCTSPSKDALRTKHVTTCVM